MKKSELKQIIKEEISKIDLSLDEQFLFENYILLGELLNPENSYEYSESILRGMWEYFDVNNNLFFVRIVYQPTRIPHFELKFGWFENNDYKFPKYDPSVPENSSVFDWDKRSNTVAKIFRDEVIPFFKKQNLTNELKICPLEIKRYLFAIRLVKKYIDLDEFDITENKPKEIKLTKL